MQSTQSPSKSAADLVTDKVIDQADKENAENPVSMKETASKAKNTRLSEAAADNQTDASEKEVVTGDKSAVSESVPDASKESKKPSADSDAKAPDTDLKEDAMPEAEEMKTIDSKERAETKPSDKSSATSSKKRILSEITGGVVNASPKSSGKKMKLNDGQVSEKKSPAKPVAEEMEAAKPEKTTVDKTDQPDVKVDSDEMTMPKPEVEEVQEITSKVKDLKVTDESKKSGMEDASISHSEIEKNLPKDSQPNELQVDTAVAKTEE